MLYDDNRYLIVCSLRHNDKFQIIIVSKYSTLS